MPSVVLHIQIQILSPRLRFLGRQTHCAGSGSEDAHVAHLLPALFTIRKGKQSSVLVFLGRLLEVFRDRGVKKPTKPKQKFIHSSPQKRYFRRAAQFLGLFTPSPDAHWRPKSQWVVLENTCTNIHTHAVLVGPFTGYPISPAF